MAQILFENNLPSGFLDVQGDVRMREEQGLFSGGGAVAPVGNFPFTDSPYNIIHADQQLDFTFNWRVQGFIPQFLIPNVRWHLRVLFESLGGNIPDPGTLAFDTGAIPLNLAAQNRILTAPAGHFIPAAGHETGENLFKVVATIVMHNNAEQITPIAGFCELGVIQVYED